MKPNQWERVWELFEEASTLPPKELEAFLEERCGQDEKLRRKVEGLLAADSERGTFLDEGLGGMPLVPDRAPSPDEETEVFPGPIQESEQIGPYRILRQIGQGGMSVVYLAVRADDTFNRRVVVKLVRPDMQSDSILERLRAERQILAGLEHPWIARLYDGGTTQDGLPYFVMEYIEGVALDEYCEQNQLTVDERLILMRKVCAAVHYAHQNLVVHRDLKPSNILVTPEGEPKLLDFGIAKMLNPELAATGLEPTVTWHRILTPNYASPEQIRGQSITTGSDVYSLGVLLYKALTGRLPHSFAGRSMHEIASILTDTEPLPPSLAVTKPLEDKQEASKLDAVEEGGQQGEKSVDLRRRLAGDLDAIVLKALRSAPHQRYGSVEQLANDIERYQTGRPVKAHKGSWTYYAKKFVYRNRRSVAALSGVLLLVFGFVVAMGLQTSRVAFERDQARLERDKKGEVLALVLELFQFSNPYVVPGEELTVREALERSVPVLKDRLHEQPDVRAELLQTSGAILSILGVYEPALDQLQEAFEIRQELHGEKHPDTVETSNALALVYKELGDLDQAEEIARQTVAITREQAENGNPTASSLNELVSVLCYRSDYEAAEEFAQEAFDLTVGHPERSIERIIALSLLARVRSAQGNYQEAVNLNREVLRRRRAHLGEKHPEQIAILNNLGVNLRQLEELEAAEEAYEEALDLVRENFGEDYVDRGLLNNLGRIRFALGDFDGAEVLFRQGLESILEVSPQHWVAFLFNARLADTWIQQGKVEEGEAALRRLLKDWDEELGDHWRADEATNVLGQSVSLQGRCEEATPILVGSFERLLEKGTGRVQKDAMVRLREHFERCQMPEKLAPFEEKLETSLKQEA